MSDLFKQRLTTAQERIADLIKTSDALGHLDVITEDKGNLNNRLKQSLNKLGLGIVVMTPSVEVVNRVESRIVLDVSFVVEVAESALNAMKSKDDEDPEKRRIPAIDAATEIMRVLDLQENKLGKGSQKTLHSRFELQKKPMQLIPDPHYVVYHVNLHTYISFN